MLAALTGLIGAASSASGGGGGASPDMISGGAQSSGATSGGFSVPMGSTFINYKSPNSGEILKPYNEGSLQNGGSPIDANRYTESLRPATLTTLGQAVDGGTDYTMLILAGVAGLGLLLLMKKRRK